ncbi:MAG: phage capsid protein [Ruminococcus sp.]|nr:phage capsid protein [Ruminococcus sp.]
MLTPDYYEHLLDELIKLYSELDNAIIADIVRRLLKNGYATETAKWQLQQLQEAGLLYEDIIAEISRYTDATQQQVRAIFEDAGMQAIKNDNVYYKSAGMSGIIKMSDAALQVLNAGYIKCSGDLSNLTLTTANTVQQAYITACNNAYMQITSGAFDYNTAIRTAVKAAAADGTAVLYPSGHRDKLDVAVRRTVLTGVGQTCRTLSETNAQDMGCDLMEITAHAGARPSHAAWQGKIVSLSGRTGYLSKADIGYGTGAGFGGWNCRHDWHPFFEGMSQRSYNDEDLEKLNEKNVEYNGNKYTDYEISQIQRKMERDIRKLKREAVAADTGRINAVDDDLKHKFDDDFIKSSAQLKEKERQLKNLQKQTRTLPDKSRVWVNGFDKSVSQKAVWADKKLLQLGDGNAIIGEKVYNFQNKLSQGKINLNIKKEKQRDHIRGDEKWKKRVADDLSNSQTPTSMFFEQTDIQKLIDSYAGKGKIVYRDEKQNYPIEYVTADHAVGKVWDSGLNRYVDTKRFVIRYSKKGVHMHPVKERE